MNEQKQRVMEAISQRTEQLVKLSHEIHDHPELGMEEHYAVGQIAAMLEREGFSVTKGLGGLDTAFQATKQGKGPGPHIAFLAEYDALPGIGHACGHNVIATCAVGAFLGLCQVMGEFDGTVSIIGTPAEETEGGKIILMEQGVFDNVDYALMMHPSSGKQLVNRGGRASTSIEMDFHGKSAHSSAPMAGIDALSAVRATFQNIDILRPTFELQDNVNGVILSGGQAANVICGQASCQFSLRARTLIDLKKLAAKVKRAAESACLLLGATVDITEHRMYAERYPSLPICQAFLANMKELGEEMCYPNPNAMYGSSDIGNVSIKIPAIHDYLSIAPAGVNSHAAEFTEASASPRADEVCVKGAQGLAMTAVDILSQPGLREEIARYHLEQVPAAYREA